MTVMEIITLIRLIVEVLKEIGFLKTEDRQALKDGLAILRDDRSTE